MVKQITEQNPSTEELADKLIKGLKNTDSNTYLKTRWDWKEWFPLQDEVMETLRNEWYMRRFVPRPQREERIQLDNPVHPQGDLIVFLLIGHPERYALAEQIAGQIEEYSNEHSTDYEPPLRIRCIIVQTAQAYMVELERAIDDYPYSLNKESEDPEFVKMLEAMQTTKSELTSVRTSIRKTMKKLGEDTEIEGKQTLRALWDNLYDSCMSFENKVNDKMESLLEKKEHALTMSIGG